jgi:hypothetical protein
LKNVVNLCAEWRNPTFAEAPVGKGHKGTTVQRQEIFGFTDRLAAEPLSCLIIIS